VDAKQTLVDSRILSSMAGICGRRTEVGALDLRHRVLLQLVVEGPGGVQPEGLARRGATGAARALQRRRAADGCDLQAEHAGAWVVAVLLAEAGVDDILRA